MFAEVVATPPLGGEGLRRLARFQLKEDTALRVGRSARSRLQVDAVAGKDVCLGLVDGLPQLWVDGGEPVRCSLNGQGLLADARHPLQDGDHLVFSSGLVLAFKVGPSRVARHPGLEATLLERPDDLDARSVYRDFLEEQGDPLAAWLTPQRRQVEAERLRWLGPLSGSERTLAVHATFSDAGLVTAVHLARHGIVGVPGLFWHLEQLSQLSVARLLTSLTIDYVVGTVAKEVLPPPSAPRGWPTSPDAELVIGQALEVLRGALFAGSLREVTFGEASTPLDLSKAERRRDALAFPRLARRSLVSTTSQAALHLLSVPPELAVFNQAPGSALRLALDTRIGAASGCQVLLVGPRAPALACRVVRRDEGWVVFAEPQAAETGQSTVKVNGTVVTRAVLRAGDELEPLAGLRFVLRSVPGPSTTAP